MNLEKEINSNLSMQNEIVSPNSQNNFFIIKHLT